jgi:hypothetical protein
MMGQRHLPADPAPAAQEQQHTGDREGDGDQHPDHEQQEAHGPQPGDLGPGRVEQDPGRRAEPAQRDQPGDRVGEPQAHLPGEQQPAAGHDEQREQPGLADPAVARRRDRPGPGAARAGLDRRRAQRHQEGGRRPREPGEQQRDHHPGGSVGHRLDGEHGRLVQAGRHQRLQLGDVLAVRPHEQQPPAGDPERGPADQPPHVLPARLARPGHDPPPGRGPDEAPERQAQPGDRGQVEPGDREEGDGDQERGRRDQRHQRQQGQRRLPAPVRCGRARAGVPDRGQQPAHQVQGHPDPAADGEDDEGQAQQHRLEAGPLGQATGDPDDDPVGPAPGEQGRPGRTGAGGRQRAHACPFLCASGWIPPDRRMRACIDRGLGPDLRDIP